MVNGEVDISEYGERKLTTVLHWFAISDSGNEILFNHFQDEILSRNLMAYNIDNLIATAWSFAQIKVIYPNELFVQIENEVLRRGTRTMSNALMVMLVWAFARKGFKDADLYEAVENEVLQRGMSVFLDHLLVLLLWSFTKAKRHNTELVNIVSQEFLQRDVKQLDGRCLSKLAWSLGRAKIKSPELFNSIEQAVTQCPPLGMTASEMCVLVRGFVEAKEESSELLNYFRDVIITGIKSLNGYDIGEVLWCFSEDQGNRSIVFSAIEKEILCRGIGSFNKVECHIIKHHFLTAGEGSKELLQMLKKVDTKANK